MSITAPTERRCTLTGLHLLRATGQVAFRVTQEQYGALTASPNEAVGALGPSAPAERRGRFDTIGRTAYLADSPECAFAEVLAGFRKDVGRLAAEAALIGADPDEYVRRVTEEAVANGVSPPWAIPFEWQMARAIHECQLPRRGWWVQIDHHETLHALRRVVPAALVPPERVAALTSADLAGEDRALTTALSQAIRQSLLDDASEPHGISFRSKTLRGRCWAYWDRRRDEGLAPGSDEPISLRRVSVWSHPAFRTVAAEYGLPILQAPSSS
ncbi:RES domain-containing protein [Georgenia yuyongxinii]|uniref:Uncharacterized protein n=1 Tax=Georgenia yuyongxinii TaxID=2589797 RepID=A0A552WYB5_9MICO|nr:RES domain-containing protein [Georgenia yuyongxinii]TRW47609.1 hypothetical protein FJ693_00430 [Georgenia yuyongxinii]